MVAFAVRRIDISLTLGTGALQGATENTVNFTNLRVEAQINKPNIPGISSAHIRIYGLTLDHINQFTKAGTAYYAAWNVITLWAGDEFSGMATIFKGWVRYSYPDFRDPKSASFFVDAISSGGGVIQRPRPSTSFKGAVTINQVFTTLSNNANLSLENNGVNGTLYNPYFWGTPWQQIVRAVKAANAFAYNSQETSKLAIWPHGGNRTPNQIYTVSPQTGMIGYPAFQDAQVQVRTQFDPSIQAMEPGFPIQIQSDLTAANGKWYVFDVGYMLSSQTPSGPWEMLLTAQSSKYQQPQGVGGGN